MLTAIQPIPRGSNQIAVYNALKGHANAAVGWDNKSLTEVAIAREYATMRYGVRVFAPQRRTLLPMQRIVNGCPFVVVGGVHPHRRAGEHQLELRLPVQHRHLAHVDRFQISRKLRMHGVVIAVQPDQPRDLGLFEKPAGELALGRAADVLFCIKLDQATAPVVSRVPDVDVSDADPVSL